MKPPSEMSTTELLLLDRDLRNRLPTAPGFPFKCRLRILMYREEIRAELEKRQAIARNLAALDDECEKIDYFIDLVYDD